jgi:hypothetical protein
MVINMLQEKNVVWIKKIPRKRYEMHIGDSRYPWYDKFKNEDAFTVQTGKMYFNDRTKYVNVESIISLSNKLHLQGEDSWSVYTKQHALEVAKQSGFELINEPKGDMLFDNTPDNDDDDEEDD